MKNRGPTLTRSQARRLELAWQAFDGEDWEKAELYARELLAETKNHPDVQVLTAALHLEKGDPLTALLTLKRCRGKVRDEVNWQYFFGTALTDALRFQEAEIELQQVVAADPEWPAAVFALAEALDLLERYEEAEEWYRRAANLDPENYPAPARMPRSAFDRVVDEAVAEMPADLQRALRRVAVVVADLPSREVLTAPAGEPPFNPRILGLFVGPRLPDMSPATAIAFPPTIFIYQRNLERVCRTRSQLLLEIGATLRHELGHFLGLSEADLHERGLQ